MRKTALSLGVVLILAACGSGAADTTTTTTTTTTLATTTTTTPATTTTTAATTTTTLDPEWWSTDEIRGYRWDERFRAVRTEGFQITAIGFQALEIATADGYAPIYRSDDDAATWLSFLTEHDQLVARDIAELEIDGRATTTMWVDLPGGSGAPTIEWCGGPCIVFFESSTYGWALVEGLPQRIWVIERDGGTFVVFTEATDEDHEGWAAVIEEWVTSIEWQ